MNLTQHTPSSLIALGLIGVLTLTTLSGCGKKAETAAPSTPAAASAPAAVVDSKLAAAPEKSSEEKKPEAKAEPEAIPAKKHTPVKHSVKQHSPDKTSAENSAVNESTSVKHTHAPVCQDCGTITAINAVEQEGQGTGLGAIAGGVAGAVLGHQVGGGSGKDLATIAGAAGGAYAGHQVEKKMKKTTRYDISVKMHDGEHRVISLPDAGNYMVGDRVKIVDGKLQRN